MIFRSNRHFLSDQKVRYKMPKLPKRWLAVGITFLGLCLGIGISATQVQATPQPVQTVNSRAASSHQNSKEAIAPTNVLNSKASVKAKSPNSRFGSPFVPRVGLKDHLHNRCCTGNDCPCEENGDECTCEDSDDNCGCIDINKSDCECEWDFNCDCDDHCNECDDNGDSNDDYGTFKIKLNNKKKDIYWGRDYTVEGSITYNKTGNFNGPLHYYYEINGGLGERVEFQGPQSVGSNPETFKFTIPHEMMVLGKKYEIYVTVEDEVENEGDDSNAARLRLITPAKIKTVDKTYYVGDPFDQFGNFDGGLNVTNQPLTKEELTDTVIRDTNGKKVRNWNKITAKPGEYTITYIYKYGSDDECGCPDLFSDGSICKKANISVIDHKKITLKYVEDSLKPIEDKYLTQTQIPEEMAPGDHSEGNYGSKFPLVKTPELLLDGQKYYDFVRFEYAVRPAPDLTEDYVTFGDYDQVINVVYKRVKSTITIEFVNSKNDQVLGSYPTPAKPFGDVLKVVPDANEKSDISDQIPEGYEYDKVKNGQLTNPEYGAGPKTIRVYVTAKEAKAPIKVEIINIKNYADTIFEKDKPLPTDTTIDSATKHLVYTIKPENTVPVTVIPHIGDEITLTDYIKLFNAPTSGNVCKLPEGYRYPIGNELTDLGLVQQEKAKFGLKEVNTKFYVAKEKKKQLLTIHHVSVNGGSVSLPDTKQVVDDNGNFRIDTKNNGAHRPPLGFRVVGASWDKSRKIDRSLPYNSGTGIITGTFPENPSQDPILNILYKRF